jgi:hypothetical protein
METGFSRSYGAWLVEICLPRVCTRGYYTVIPPGLNFSFSSLPSYETAVK